MWKDVLGRHDLFCLLPEKDWNMYTWLSEKYIRVGHSCRPSQFEQHMLYKMSAGVVELMWYNAGALFGSMRILSFIIDRKSMTRGRRSQYCQRPFQCMPLPIWLTHHGAFLLEQVRQSDHTHGTFNINTYFYFDAHLLKSTTKWISFLSFSFSMLFSIGSMCLAKCQSPWDIVDDFGVGEILQTEWCKALITILRLWQTLLIEISWMLKCYNLLFWLYFFKFYLLEGLQVYVSTDCDNTSNIGILSTTSSPMSSIQS